MRVFLTGGTGFIGQPLAAVLIARGWEVIALVRNPNSSQARALNRMVAQCVQGDVTNRQSMREGMMGSDIVIHNAGWYEYGVSRDGKKLMHTVNVQGTENVLSLAQELSIPRAVYVSSTLAFGETGPKIRDETFKRQAPFRSYYEQTKAEANTIAKQHQQQGFPLIIVCPNGVVGPNDHSPFGYFLRLYLNKLLPPFAWAPDMIVSLVHVDDLAEGIALAAVKGQPGETYIFAGDSITRREMVALWATKPGACKIRFWLPMGLTGLLFAPLEPLQRKVGLPAFISRETVLASRSTNYSSEKAIRQLGWTHRSAEEMWIDIIEQELKLLETRQKRDLVSRLKPVDVYG